MWELYVHTKRRGKYERHVLFSKNRAHVKTAVLGAQSVVRLCDLSLRRWRRAGVRPQMNVSVCVEV